MAEERKKSSAPSVKMLEAEEVVPSSAVGTYHLNAVVEEGAHVIVELATPLETITYDQGTVPDGKLDLKFPVPEDEGDVLLRVVTVDEEGKRNLVHSETL